MNKIFVLFFAAFTLSACSSTPEKKPQTVAGELTNQKEAVVHLQDTPAVTRVQFNTTGYTIFGALYVAGAVAQMNEDSKEMQSAYETYLKNHPTTQPLGKTFNTELGKQLLNSGITLKVVPAKKTLEDKVAHYKINPNETNGHDVIISDGLLVQFFAKSSTDDYHPKAGVNILVMDSKGKSTLPYKKEVIFVESDKAYKDFESIKKDPDQAYLELQKTVKILAQKVADVLTGKVSPDENVISKAS